MTGPAPAGGHGLSSVHLNQHEMLALGGAAVAAVVGGLLYKQKKAKTAAGAAGTPTASSTTTAAAGAAAASTGSAPVIAGLSGSPDTTATDIQNWLQDQANQLNTQGAAAATNPDVFDPTNADTSVNTAGTGSIWQNFPDGGSIQLTPAQYAAIIAAGGKPTNTPYNDPSQVAARRASTT